MQEHGKAVDVIVFNKHGVGHMARVERFPQPGETLRALEWHFDEDGGKGTNVAVALGLLGVGNALVCTVGNDSGGKLGQRWLRDAGVDLAHYRMSEDVATDVGLVVTRTDGENVVIGSPRHPCYTTEAELREAIDAYPGARYFATGFEIDQKLPLWGCRYAKERGKITLLNPSPLLEPIEGSLEYVDYLFVNRVEGKQLSGLADESGETVARAAWERYRPGTLVMTLGGDGCVLCREGRATYYPPYRVRCVDSVAAGDGFMAAFIAGLSWGMSDGEAADWANRYGAVVVSRKGAILSYPALTEARKAAAALEIRQQKEGARQDVL